METLYHDPIYASHLQARNNQQPIMLGFSDGTKDGGYLQADSGESIKPKRVLTAISRKNNIVSEIL
jgi:phosphoenolpyruvate carboxylase